MQLSESWLRSMCNPPMDTAALTHTLTMAGLEVESCEPIAAAFSGVVVAEVLRVERHPNADKLSLCQVAVGEAAPLQIVCGAPNVRAGMKAPLARVGAQLTTADGKTLSIGVAKMRGIESQGMLCSARELGLSEDHGGLLELPSQSTVGSDVRALLALDDQRITIKLTPNKADCLSVLGIARELSALTGAPLQAPVIQPVPAVSDVRFGFKSSAHDACGRFTGRVIRKVNAHAATPEWMRQRLERAGQRSISALVDITNFVMLEMGRPLHVYDLDKLSGEIDVRWGRQGERLKLLNDQVVDLDASVLCITDASGPIGLAGIMGGDSTKAELSTQHIFLESAFFAPNAIAGRARRFNFSSDASHRFERGVDFNNNVAGIERATALVLEICGGEPGPTVDQTWQLPTRQSVKMRSARACKVIGVPITGDEMADIFSRLGLAHTRTGHAQDEVFTVSPPSFRFDLEIEEDLIEEVARVWGFERIPAQPPRAVAAMRAPLESVRGLHALRHRLAASDFQEVVNFSFVDAAWERDLVGNAAPIQVLNPIASQLAVMRSALIGGLLDNIRYNVARKQARVRVFEIGRAFLRDPSALEGPVTVAGLHQPIRIAAAAFGAAFEPQWGVAERDVDFFDLKADLEALVAPLRVRCVAAAHPALHPGRSARIELEGRAVGWIGEIHPRWQAQFELPKPPVVFELDADALQHLKLPRAEQPSRFPAVVRDLAVLVHEATPVQALLDAIEAEKIGLIQCVNLFDLYHGQTLPKGQKSLAFRVVMQDTVKTLTDADADAVFAQITKILQQKFNATLRS